ncbi:hypothetical protein RHECNPAF_1340051 [Rhizobium etli CNPAF512]|nr:hypothetical protein RHECNPAF_1340051 [Rhizobium etli CNPAF512]
MTVPLASCGAGARPRPCRRWRFRTICRGIYCLPTDCSRMLIWKACSQLLEG